MAVFLTGIIVGRLFGRPASGTQRQSRNRTRSKPVQTTPGAVELYVGNLAYEVDERELESIFSKHGKVVSSRIIRNHFNNKSKGFGFVEIAGDADATSAVAALHGADIRGRKIMVNEARSNSRHA